jgi:hypothetical protein
MHCRGSHCGAHGRSRQLLHRVTTPGPTALARGVVAGRRAVDDHLPRTHRTAQQQTPRPPPASTAPPLPAAFNSRGRPRHTCGGARALRAQQPNAILLSIGGGGGGASSPHTPGPNRTQSRGGAGGRAQAMVLFEMRSPKKPGRGHWHSNWQAASVWVTQYLWCTCVT